MRILMPNSFSWPAEVCESDFQRDLDETIATEKMAAAIYTKTTKEIQRSRRERARSENERRLHRSTTTTTTTEGETDGRASSSSPPFPIICPKPHSLFSADDAHSAHHHGHSPRTQPPTTPDQREKVPFFLAFQTHPTPRLARVHSPGPRFRMRMRMRLTRKQHTLARTRTNHSERREARARATVAVAF